jgi:hypothetical protein
MSEGARYAPSGPGTEAAIEVEIQVPGGPVYFRIPFSTFAKAFRTASDSREDMFKTFIDKNFGIWPKISQKVPLMFVGDVYTVTPQDLS